VDSVVHEFVKSLSSKSTEFCVGDGNGVGDGSGVLVGMGVGVATKLETAEHASMVTNNSAEKEMTLMFFIFAPVNKFEFGDYTVCSLIEKKISRHTFVLAKRT